MLQILTQIRQLIVNLILFLFNEFDPIKNVQTSGMVPNSGYSQKWPHLLGLYATLALVLQVAFGLESIPSLDHLEVSFKTAITHRLFPDTLATQLDLVCSIVVPMLALILLCLLVYPSFNQKHLMFKIKDPQTKTETLRYLSHSFNSRISNQILAFRRKARFILKRSIQFFYLIVEIYFSYQILRSGYWSWNFQTLLFWLLHFQLFVLYVVFCKCNSD